MHVTPFQLTDSHVQEQAEPVYNPSTRRRRSTPSSDGSATDGDVTQGSTSEEQLVKKFVRLALACEHSRQPIRRADVIAKGGWPLLAIFTTCDYSTELAARLESNTSSIFC